MGDWGPVENLNPVSTVQFHEDRGRPSTRFSNGVWWAIEGLHEGDWGVIAQVIVALRAGGVEFPEPFIDAFREILDAFAEMQDNDKLAIDKEKDK